MTVHYYIWYRVAGDPGAARTAVDALMRDVFANAGVTGRLLVRRDDPRTWMEVYENVADAQRFEGVLTAGALRHEVARFSEDGKRHLEPFLGI